MIDDRPSIDSRGHAWTVFFGVAAISIGLLVVTSRLLSAFEGTAAAPAGEPVTFTVAGGLAPPRSLTSQHHLDLQDSDLEPAAATSSGVPAAEASETAAACGGGCPGDGGSSPKDAADVGAAAPPSQAPRTAAVPTVAPPAAAVVPPPAVSAASYAIIERSCGAAVAGKNENARLAPASVTKIVTAMVVAERADLNRVVEVRDVSAKWMIRHTDSSVMGIEPGMRFSVRDLMYGLLLPSGNDAALALADAVSGGVPGFVAAMNQKASELGMVNTHFSNPHGLDQPGHFSTALDMARAGRAFLNNGVLAAMSVQPQYETPGDVRILMKNGNRLLQTYPGAFGVKIGYTTNARQTIVAAAARDGRELVLAVFSSEDRYADSAALFDWAFANTANACR
ncbi:MAG TPA: serine hydrolase [Dehalococcoidia bacterium]|nr:serine hydrolase [Dehalococcoidia bacterium]